MSCVYKVLSAGNPPQHYSNWEAAGETDIIFTFIVVIINFLMGIMLILDRDKTLIPFNHNKRHLASDLIRYNS